jgi:hypothetical protein
MGISNLQHLSVLSLDPEPASFNTAVKRYNYILRMELVKDIARLMMASITLAQRQRPKT